MNRLGILPAVMTLFFCMSMGQVHAQWGSSVPPGENFFHSVGYGSTIDRLADYEWIKIQEQLKSRYPLGVTIQNFEGGLTTNTSIGVLITDSPGAVGTNNGEVSAQTNTGNRGGTANGSVEQQQSLTVSQPSPKQQPCQRECSK